MQRLFRPPDVVGELERLLTQIPAGRVTTCGDLAEALGDRAAVRWIGQYLAGHQHKPHCTCHRVVQADGRIADSPAYPGPAKATRLRAEGVRTHANWVDLQTYGFRTFHSCRPLEQLARLQLSVASQSMTRSPGRMPKTAAGLDVSYPNSQEAVGAYALVEVTNGKLRWSVTVRRCVRFPYITGYLSFRELPVLLDLLQVAETAGSLADVYLIDGSGILHPRRAGIATHFGVITGLPTVGVTKTLLCGSGEFGGMRALEARPVLDDGRVLALALRPTAGSRRPIFISVGNGLSLKFAEKVVRRLLLGRRLPEPLHWADRLSRRAGCLSASDMRLGGRVTRS